MRKTLRNHQEVAHVWANQSQDEGRASNVFFRGPSIFSYGEHFEIARHVAGVVLFTTRSYSVSTAKHKTIVSRALSHKTVFHVPSMTDHNANVTAYLTDIKDYLAQAKRAQYSAWRIQQAGRLLAEATAYVKHFKKEVSGLLRLQVNTFKAKGWPSAKVLKQMKAREEHFRAGAEARAKARRDAEHARYEKIMKRREEETAALNLWGEEIETLTAEAFRNGERIPRDSWSYGAPVLLRLIEDGKTIETSQGAYVPTEQARGLWALMQNGGDIKGVEIGSYTVSGIRNGKLIIGCHQIPLREVAKMASKLGLEGGLR